MQLYIPQLVLLQEKQKKLAKAMALQNWKTLQKRIFIPLGIACNMIHIILVYFKAECLCILCLTYRSM